MKPLIRFPDNKKCPRCGYQMPLFGLGLVREKKKWFTCPACDAKLEWHPGAAIIWGSVLSGASMILPALGESPWVIAIVLALVWTGAAWFVPVAFATWQPPLEGDRHDNDPESRRRRRIRKTLFRGTLMVIGVYVGLTLLLFALQSKMLYFPSRWMDETPGDVGLDYTDVTFEAADGVKLHGWFVPAEDARAVILFCHGNAGNISNRNDTLRIFNKLRLSTFIFDYRGYGKSEGKPTEEGTYLDAEGAWKHLTDVKGVRADEIFVSGRSLGAAVAAHLAVKVRPKGLILESAFTSVPDRAAELYPILPIRSICRYSYSTLEAVERTRCPVLIVHSEEDTLIPIHHGRKLYESSGPADKTFLEITGDHNWGFMTSGKRYTDGLDRFIAKELQTERHYVD